MRMTIKRVTQWMSMHKTILKLIFFGSIIIFVANQVAHIADGMSWQAIFNTMAQQSRWRLFWMALIGCLGILPMLTYDWVTVKVLEKQGAPKHDWKLFLIQAWTTNTINNLAGFGGVVGASLRASFYGKKNNRKQVLATVSKIALFLLAGLSLWSLITFIFVFFIQENSLYKSYWIWLLAGSVILPAIASFSYLNRKTLFKELYPKELLQLVTGSFGQWTGALFVFLFIGYMMDVQVNFFAIYPMFIIATLIGMLTMVPGGMGTFDVLMILGMSQLGIEQDVAVVWLLFYRLFYYVVPFFSGIVLFLSHTSVKINRFLDNLPQQLFQKFAHFLLVSAVYSAGILMVLLATIRNLSAISRLFQYIMPFSFDFFDQTLNLLIGFLLIGLGRALAMKVKRAYLPTISLLIFGIINTISRTLSWRLIVFYLAILLIVWLSRKEFYREKFVYSWGAILFDSLLFGFLFIVYAIAGYHSGQYWVGKLTANNFLLFPSDDVWFSGLIGLAVSLLALVALYQYLSTSDTPLGEEADTTRLQQLVELYGGTVSSHYLRLPNYRYFYYQEDGQDEIIFGYQIKFNKCFILGDPIGNPAKRRAATTAFMKAADKQGYQLAFYKITEKYVVLLHELGFHFTKIGETGIVDLAKEEEYISGMNEKIMQLKHEGYAFSWYDRLPTAYIPMLKTVSEAWLDGAFEKNFSVGRFDTAYIMESGVGLVTCNEKIVGFITEKPITYKQVSYDLLRVLPDQPAELGDYLLANTFIHFKKRGYRAANLGLAPLVGVGETDFSFFEEKIMHIAYNYGNFVYDFQTIYAQQVRYVDYWEGRYFAFRKDANVFFATAQLFMLIGKGKHKNRSLAEDILIDT